MKKVLSLVLVLTIILSVVFSLNSYAYTNFSGANTAVFNTTYNGTLTNSKNEYCYRFSLSSSGQVIIKSSAYLKCEYVLYDSNYEELYCENMRWAESTNGIYNYSETFDLVSGTYYFSVKQYDGTGNYNLRLTFSSANESFAESVNNIRNSINSADRISIGQKYQGQIAYNDSIDYYTFNLTSSGLLTMKSLAESKCNYYIYDEEYNEVYSLETRWFDYSGDYINVNEKINLKKGTYFLGIFQYDGTGAYDILLNFSSANESFVEDIYTNNNSVKKANNVKINTLYNGHLGINDDTDYYSFSLNKKTKLTIKSTAYFKCNFALYNSEMDEIFDESTRWYDFTADVIVFSKEVTLSAGSYYLRIVPYDGLGNYNFIISEKTEHTHYYYSYKVNPKSNVLGYTYYYCSCGKDYIGSYTAPTGKVGGLKLKSRNDSSITVTWNKVSGVSGYQIQTCTKDGKKWSTYATLGAGTNTYTFKKLASGNNYKFRCRFFIKGPDGKTYNSPWCGTVNAPTLPKGMTLSKLTAAKKAFTAQWKKQSGVTGYQVQYSTSSKFTSPKIITVKNVKTLKATAKNLSAKKTYYVRVRTYKTINKVNYCSAWSKTYKVKTK